MSLYGSLSRHKNLDEIATPNQYPKFQSVATRQGLARANLGLGGGAVTAGTAVPLAPMVTDANNGIKGYRDTRNPPLFNQPAANALNATGTLTAALMVGALVTSTSAAAVTATLDTGANLETALIALYPNLQNNDWFEFNVINTGPSNFTIATAAGWTDGGNGFTAVGPGTNAMFGVRRTAANAYTIYKVAGPSASTPGTSVANQPLVADANNGIGFFRHTSIPPVYSSNAPLTLNATGTFTAAMILNKIVTSSTAAAVVGTTDTGTAIETAILAIYPNIQVGDYWEFVVINTGPNTFTFALGTNVTDGGNALTAIAATNQGRFGIRRTSANNYVLYRIQ